MKNDFSFRGPTTPSLFIFSFNQKQYVASIFLSFAAMKHKTDWKFMHRQYVIKDSTRALV